MRDDTKPRLLEGNSPLGCLVRSTLLVLGVFRCADTRSILSSAAERAGHKLVQTSSTEQARILLNNGVEPDLLVFEAPNSGGSYELRQVFRAVSPSPLCVISGPGEQRLRDVAAELGVTRFLDRPPVDGEVSRVFDSVRGPERESVAPADVRVFEEEDIVSLPGNAIVEELGDGRYFLAASPTMLKIHRQVRLLADVDAPVLILGESGTGKEVIAHLIHKYSRRAHHRFVNVNCAALPSDLLESELFGYHQGAFTGAIKDKPGKF